MAPCHCLGRAEPLPRSSEPPPESPISLPLILQTQGMFWFAHKPVKAWITELMDPKSRTYLRRVRVESVGKKKRPVWLPMCVRR